MTMKAIDRAKAHYNRMVDAPIEIPVPEWAEEGEEFIIYCTPLTLQDRTRLNRYAKTGTEMSAEMLIMKAKDKEGNALFTKEDKPDLMRHASSGIIARIVVKIQGQSDEEFLAEAEKN